LLTRAVLFRDGVISRIVPAKLIYGLVHPQR
jgi:hypothetical protein